MLSIMTGKRLDEYYLPDEDETHIGVPPLEGKDASESREDAEQGHRDRQARSA